MEYDHLVFPLGVGIVQPDGQRGECAAIAQVNVAGDGQGFALSVKRDIAERTAGDGDGAIVLERRAGEIAAGDGAEVSHLAGERAAGDGAIICKDRIPENLHVCRASDPAAEEQIQRSLRSDRAARDGSVNVQ